MFGLFKKKIDFKTVLSDFADDLSRVKDTVDDLAEESGLTKSANYGRESAALVYILGWLSIQTSNLGASDKHRFSAELTGEWSKRINNGVETIETINFLQNRIGLYRDAMDNGEGRDWMARLSIKFLEHFGANTQEHTAIMGTLYMSVPQYLKALGSFLNDVNRQYKFV